MTTLAGLLLIGSIDWALFLLLGCGQLADMGFPRAWQINESLVLFTHQHVDDKINGASS